MTDHHIQHVQDSGDSLGIQGISLQAGGKILIREGNLSLHLGERYGVCGKNGSGKTSLLQCLHQRLGGIYIDQYVADERWLDISIVDAILQSDSERTLALEAYQKIEAGDVASEDMDAHHQQKMTELDRDRSEVQKILHGLGFTDQQFEYPYSKFSGGWRTRVSLARALFMKPRLLFLDEPTNHLDMEAIVWLKKYVQEFKGILLVVSHNIDFLNEVSTHIVHLVHSNLRTYRGNYFKFLQQKEADLKKQESDWEKFQKELRGLKSKGLKKEAAALEKKKTGEGVVRPEKPYKVIMDFQTGPTVKSPYIQLQGVEFSYGPELPLLVHNLHFQLENDTKIAILGKNGCGKSTFLKILKGELQPTQGTRLVNENVVVSYFHQHSVEELPEDKTPVEYLQEKHPQLSVQEIRQYLGKISLEPSHHTRPIKVLSGGQRMRIAFSDVCIMNPHVLFLDEPTNHLDIETIDCLVESLKNYNGSVVLISHDAHIIEETECILYHLEGGQLKILQGGLEEYEDLLFREETLTSED